MMDIRATVIERTVNSQGVECATIEATFPRFILAEVNTHRVVSKNSASSRAIPTKKIIDSILSGPAMPLRWLSNKPGMQGGEELSEELSDKAYLIWNEAMHDAIHWAQKLEELGVHKQHLNRLLEPFMMHKALLTSTRWANLFRLRDHPDAQPEFRELALQIKLAFSRTPPTPLVDGQWHLPFIKPEERIVQFDSATLSFREPEYKKLLYDIGRIVGNVDLAMLLIMSAARCARLSYRLVDGSESDFGKDIAVFSKLSSNPLHASPMEHQARARGDRALVRSTGNLHGFDQFRKMLPNEAIDEAFPE